MKLLICTQVVDQSHPILGFFHRWIEEFAKHCDVVHVVCLYEGTHKLPSNVHVHSLGKEKKESRIQYLLRFYTYIWNLRSEYDNVFVHMNQVYVILGSIVWKVLGKRVGLWYAHGSVNMSLKLAEKLADMVFTASVESFKMLSKKIRVTGHGIDTSHFAPTNVTKDLDLITVGRISRTKNLHTLLDIFASIRNEQDVTLTIIGEPVTLVDTEYKNELEEKIVDLDLTQHVHFVGSVTQDELPDYLNRAKVFVHTAQNGSLDKAVLEPLAVGIPVISCAPGSFSLPSGFSKVLDENSFKDSVIQVLKEDDSNHARMLREFVQKEHSLETLIPKLLNNY